MLAIQLRTRRSISQRIDDGDLKLERCILLLRSFQERQIVARQESKRSFRNGGGPEKPFRIFYPRVSQISEQNQLISHPRLFMPCVYNPENKLSNFPEINHLEVYKKHKKKYSSLNHKSSKNVSYTNDSIVPHLRGSFSSHATMHQARFGLSLQLVQSSLDQKLVMHVFGAKNALFF